LKIHETGCACDKSVVSSFLQIAEEILDSAAGGREDCHLAILVGRDGGIHMLADSDWDLGRLREHHAASSAYRVTRRGGQVQLEARADGQSCTLRREPAARALRPSLPAYRLLSA
jgi:hypothetical protein